MTFDFLVTAEDTIGAYGSNKVECKESSKYFGIAKPGAGPRRETVAVTMDYADKDTIQTACKGGLPTPKEVFGELGKGEAWVPEGSGKSGRFVIGDPGNKISRKFVGDPSLIDRCLVTLATSRGLMLL